MGREINRLSARRVQTLQIKGRHADGGGLYLVVDSATSKRWVMLYRLGGRRREMGLGSVLSVSLARARELAEAARQTIAGGIDPLEAKRAPPKKAAIPTFGEVAISYMADRETLWRNEIHRKQWRHTLEQHGAHIWKMTVDTIDTDAVLTVLRPLWAKHPETARRLRGRIERILDAAKVQGHRTGENPARWTGHLSMLLTKPQKLTRGHHAAMPYEELPAFVAELRRREGRAARALELLILTASRSGEVRGIVWGELNGGTWTVPAARMKGKREHRVPLTARALELLDGRRGEGTEPDQLIFPGPRSGKQSSDMVFAALMKRMKKAHFTTHGFRSSFRDWASDKTDFPSELAEAALAHLVGDETERAYRRGDALEKRRHLMEAWAVYLASACGDASKKSTKAE